MKFLIIDNYDSFVYNIAQRLGELGIISDVIRNDKITINDIEKSDYNAIIISQVQEHPMMNDILEFVKKSSWKSGLENQF